MTILNGYTNAVPHHRQNRRRERPGSRTRRTIARKSIIQSVMRDDYNQGILDARDSAVPLPSDKSKPSPLLRQNFDQSWQRWKAREAEEKAQQEMVKLQLEQERVLLFGGEVDDDELFRLGILYSDDGEQQDSNVNAVLCDVPLRQEAPMFVMKPSRRSRRRRSTWRSSTLPLYLSFSALEDDPEIAHLLSPKIPHSTPTIQHRDNIPSTTASIIDIDVDVPQSLPPLSPALSSSSGPPNFLNINTPKPVLASEDWTFINPHHTTHDLTPSSEPETDWILCDDS